MRKPDEIAFYASLRARCDAGAPHPGLDAVMQEIQRNGIPEGRACYLLKKWCHQGLWDFGVSLRCGWFTDKAPQELGKISSDV